MLRDDDPGTALIELGNDRVAVKRLVCEQRAKIDALEKRIDADGVKAMPGHKNEADEIASASVKARILVVIPPFERPMAWLWVPLLHLARGGEP